MRRTRGRLLLVAVVALATACGSVETTPDDTAAPEEEPEGSTEEPEEDDEPETEGSEDDGGEAEGSEEFFDQAEFEEELRLRDVEPEGPEDRPWEQMLEPEMVDTSEYETEGPWHVCFSNASVANPWRQVGWTTMQAEVEDAQADTIEEFTAVDAEASDEQQISDINSLLNDDCDALIISPNTTAALTPAVEDACDSGIPVIVFDRGVNTDCPTTYVHPIGGYAFGAAGANFLVDNVEEGGKILGLRVLPGVDVLETRWAAAQQIFEDSELEVVGSEFTENDPATAKSIVTDYIQREGGIDGIWMDDGTAAVAVTEAFEDLGQEVPPVVGEDQQAFLDKWAAEPDLDLIAPTYPTYQWRTAVIAATDILAGEEVPSEWILPQPVIDDENFDEFYVEGLPPLFYAACGCQDMESFPERWE